jgi:hypothetical protein
MDVWVFGIAYLKIVLFEMALTHFLLHVLHMWKDDDQVDAPTASTSRPLSPTSRVKAYVCSKYIGWQSMKFMTV